MNRFDMLGAVILPFSSFPSSVYGLLAFVQGLLFRSSLPVFFPFTVLPLPQAAQRVTAR